MMNNRQPIPKITLEASLYGAALLLALVLRLYNLGSAPLTDSEAGWAMQGLQLARPALQPAAWSFGSQPAYVILTGISFALFGASDFLARFWPALLGGLLALAPYAWRRELGRSAALILAFGLALDPGLVVVSRQAGGPMLALGFGLLSLSLWRLGRTIASGILAGAALLSGPAILTGGLGVGAALGLTRLLKRPAAAQTTIEGEIEAETTQQRPLNAFWQRPELRKLGIVAAAGVLLIGTFFIRYPQGLSAWFATLPDYLSAWTAPSGVSAVKLLATLIFYQPFALIFAIVGIGRLILGSTAEASPSEDAIETEAPIKEAEQTNITTSALLWLWFLAALLLALLPAGRQVADLVWALPPLWALAALELAHYLPEGKVHATARLTAVAEAILVLILCGLFWNTMIASTQSAVTVGIPTDGLRLAVLAGVLALIALTTALVSLGWSWRDGQLGLVWGLSAAFLIYLTAALWGAAQLRPNQPQELWGTIPGSGQADLLSKTIADLSNWNTGFPQMIDIISEVDTPSLRWLLRDMPNSRFVNSPAIDERPSLLLTRSGQETPALTAAYRGQDFAWWVLPGWEGMLPPDTISWLAFRQAPTISEQIILWARSDLFPGSDGASSPTIGPDNGSQ